MAEQRRWHEPVQLVKVDVVYGGSVFFVCAPVPDVGGTFFTRLTTGLAIETILNGQTLMPIERGPRWDQIAELGRAAFAKEHHELWEKTFKDIED